MESTEIKRREIAKELLFNCPIAFLDDHRALADAVLGGADWETIRNMDQMDKYPDTAFWLENSFAAL